VVTVLIFKLRFTIEWLRTLRSYLDEDHNDPAAKE
jgi:hypothetical protein